MGQAKAEIYRSQMSRSHAKMAGSLAPMGYILMRHSVLDWAGKSFKWARRADGEMVYIHFDCHTWSMYPLGFLVYGVDVVDHVVCTRLVASAPGADRFRGYMDSYLLRFFQFRNPIYGIYALFTGGN